MSGERKAGVAPQVVLGLGIILFGALWTLDNLELVDAHHFADYWPLLLVLFGATRLTFGRAHDLGVAAIWIGLGIWFLAFNLGYVYHSPWNFFWPLVLIVLGINLALGALWRESRQSSPADSVDFLDGFAILGSLRRRSNSQALVGGNLTAIMGGCHIDLRDAKIQNGPAVLRVLACWGGVSISVPEGWVINSRVVPILGGYHDHTAPSTDPDPPQLEMRGLVLMGGVEVNNRPDDGSEKSCC